MMDGNQPMDQIMLLMQDDPLHSLRLEVRIMYLMGISHSSSRMLKLVEHGLEGIEKAGELQLMRAFQLGLPSLAVTTTEIIANNEGLFI